jgi:hypothetical protein
LGFKVWDFNNSFNWNLALRNTYNAVPITADGEQFQPIPVITVTVTSRILLIGARNLYAKPNWFLAAKVNPRLFFSPSSTSQFLPAIASYPRVKIGLGRLNLVRFNSFDLPEYVLEITPEKWHKQLMLEIWQYTGELGDLETNLARIETKINSLS